jgi:hypothetical protein
MDQGKLFVDGSTLGFAQAKIHFDAKFQAAGVWELVNSPDRKKDGKKRDSSPDGQMQH